MTERQSTSKLSLKLVMPPLLLIIQLLPVTTSHGTIYVVLCIRDVKLNIPCGTYLLCLEPLFVFSFSLSYFLLKSVNLTRHSPLPVGPHFSELVEGTVRTWEAWLRSAVVPSFLHQAIGPIPRSGGVHPSNTRKIKEEIDIINSDTSRTK